MRTINVIGASVTVEEVGDQGSVTLGGFGTLNRSEVQELVDYLTAHLRETKDNVAQTAQVQSYRTWWDIAKGDAT